MFGNRIQLEALHPGRMFAFVGPRRGWLLRRGLALGRVGVLSVIEVELDGREHEKQEEE